mgnify:CR=1 FL=1
MAVYGAMIDRLAQNIGRLLSKLDKMKVRENTLILFLSDNGASAEVVNLKKGTGEIGALTGWTSLGPDWANVSNVPLRYFKNYSHEGGIKTPMLFHWPARIKEGNRISSTPLHLVDLMPTLAELSNAKYPTEYNNQSIIPMDGMSFLPILKGEDAESAYFLSTNRNKRSASVNIATPAGQKIIRALVQQSDVLLENFKVGTLAAYGLGPNEMLALNPRLIYCSISAFGQTGSRTYEPGYDAISKASAGLMSITGPPPGETGGTP